jgi:diaminopimelate decarboxylase
VHSFHYRDRRLHCEETDLGALADRFGTPLYVYSAATILDHYRRLDEAFAEVDHQICYAVKANSNGAILKLLAEAGAGFDIVSGGELFRVLKAGGEAARCTFAGVGKTSDEIAFALDAGVFSFNVESEAELENVSRIAAAKSIRAAIALRVNPDVATDTHQYISTGTSGNKFGIALDRVRTVYKRAAEMNAVRIRGVQMHLGSQINETRPFVEAIEKMTPLVLELRRRYGIEFFSIGGGVGIVYESSLASGGGEWWSKTEAQPRLTIKEYATATLPLLRRLGLRILLEPGRILVGNAGVLLTRVLYRKESAGKKFVIVDAGMNDLIRPALYQSYHEIVPLLAPPDEKREMIDLVGPVCESGDFFALNRELPELQAGDLVALMSAGAYGFAMASNYNSRPLPAEVLVRGERAALIRERQTNHDLTRGERAPEF